MQAREDLGHRFARASFVQASPSFLPAAKKKPRAILPASRGPWDSNVVCVSTARPLTTHTHTLPRVQYRRSNLSRRERKNVKIYILFFSCEHAIIIRTNLHCTDGGTRAQNTKSARFHFTRNVRIFQFPFFFSLPPSLSARSLPVPQTPGPAPPFQGSHELPKPEKPFVAPIRPESACKSAAVS